jgi:thiol-disulfide isomerase/thioredoxin
MFILIISSILLCCVLLFMYFFNKNVKKVIDKNVISNIDKFEIINNNNTVNTVSSVNTVIKPQEPVDDIKMMIFVATWCGACNAYKNNIHNNLSKELANVYKNIKFEFVVDDPKNEKIVNLQKYFEIKYFPTIILYKNDKFKKLPMNESITKSNIVKLVDSI